MRAMKTMLAQITSRFHELNHTYVLGEGTLLGIVRDGDLIRWDTDIDIHLPACQTTIDLFLRDEFLQEFQTPRRCTANNSLVTWFQSLSSPEFSPECMLKTAL